VDADAVQLSVTECGGRMVIEALADFAVFP